MNYIVTVGRKHALYLPKGVVERMQLKEGERLLLTVEGDRIVLRRVPDFFAEAKRSLKKLRLTPEEVEKASEEAQRELLGLGDA